MSPLFGLAFLAMLGYYGAHAGLTMRQILPVALVLAAIFLVAGLYHRKRTQAKDTPIANSLHPAELAVFGLLTLGSWLLHIAPVLAYGTLTPIGDNWDVEFYLPLTDYLKDYSYQTLAHAPANPLRNLLLTDRLAARAMGATYTQAIADILTGRDAWDSWVPMLAVFRAITVGSLYMLLRGGLGIRPVGALIGVALAGTNSLLLWTTYNSFGMGLGGLALLPAALLCTIAALEPIEPPIIQERQDSMVRMGNWNLQAVLSAAFLLGGMTCTYWPMLMAYGAAGLGIGLALLWQHRSGDWLGVVKRSLLVLSIGILIALPVHMHAQVAFVSMFTAQTPSMGVFEFLAPTVLAGSAPYSHRGLPDSGMLATLLAWGGFAIALVLLALGTWCATAQRQRSIAVGIVLCIVLYLLGLRFIVGYPYGYLRGASYVNTLLLGIVGAGIGVGLSRVGFPKSLLEGTKAPPIPPARRGEKPDSHPCTGGLGGEYRNILLKGISTPRIIGHIVLSIVLLISVGVAASRTYAIYAERPGVWSLEMAGLRAAVANLEQPGPVAISSAPELHGPYTGALAYILRKRELIGVLSTGYTSFVNTQPGIAPAYGIVYRHEDPREYGLNDVVWHDARAALYSTPTDRLSWVSGRSNRAATESALLAHNTTYSRAQAGIGNYLHGNPDAPLAMPDALAFPTTPSTGAGTGAGTVEVPSTGAGTGAGGEYVLNLALGSFVTQTVELTIGDNSQSFTVPAGASSYHTAPLDSMSMADVSLRPHTAPIFLRWASLEANQAPESAQQTTAFDDTVLLSIASESQTATSSRTHIETLIPAGDMLRFAVEIYEDVPGYTTAPAHYAWSLFPAPREGMHTLDIDVQTPTMMFDGMPLEVQTGALRDGHFFAALWLYQGEQVRRVVPFLRFERVGGVVQALQPLDVNMVFTRLEQPAQTLDGALFAQAIELSGFTFAETHLPPGATGRVSLLWEAKQPLASTVMVFVQVLDNTNRKIAEWNGAVGGDWIPTTAWQPSMRMWQDIPLAIAPDASSGTYRVIAGLFDPATGERLRLPDDGDHIVLGEVVVP